MHVCGVVTQRVDSTPQSRRNSRACVSHSFSRCDTQIGECERPVDRATGTQVRVVHNPGAPARLPLRVKAFAVLQRRLRSGLASAWLPCEIAPEVGAPQHGSWRRCSASCACKEGATVPLKGPSVQSHCFAYCPVCSPQRLVDSCARPPDRAVAAALTVRARRCEGGGESMNG